MGCDERAVCEIHPVASRLCSDTFDCIDYPIGGLLLKIGIDGYEERGKDCGEETCLYTHDVQGKSDIDDRKERRVSATHENKKRIDIFLATRYLFYVELPDVLSRGPPSCRLT